MPVSSSFLAFSNSRSYFRLFSSVWFFISSREISEASSISTSGEAGLGGSSGVVGPEVASGLFMGAFFSLRFPWVRLGPAIRKSLSVMTTFSALLSDSMIPADLRRS